MQAARNCKRRRNAFPRILPACGARPNALHYPPTSPNDPTMKTPLILIATAALIFTTSANAQTAPGAKPAAGMPPAGAAKAKPFSANDAHIYLAIADGIQFQLNMSLRVRGKYKDGPQDFLDLAGKISKESTELWTPGVEAAMAHGVDGKKIPNDLSKNDKANLNKLATIKDEKKWQLAFFEFYAKESKKNAADADKGAKAAQDADLKAFAEKAAALLKTQAETVEAKFKELKTTK
jgi:hypothetical protein